MITAIAFTAPCTIATVAGEPNVLVNAGFDKDLSGWTVEGDAAVDTAAPMAGAGSLRLGPGKSAVRQTYKVGGLRIVYFGATVKTNMLGVMVRARVQCFDSRHHQVMDLTQNIDPQKNDEAGQKPGLYFKTHALTASMVVSFEKTSKDHGLVFADSAELIDYDHDRVDHDPICNIDQYMQPIWKGSTVYNETVLLESDSGKPAAGKLLFMPSEIISVQDYSLATTYTKGRDYTVDGKTITALPGAKMPMMKDTEYPTGDIAWYELEGKQIVVTYTHSDTWFGPIPEYVGDSLPRTMKKLRSHKLLTIAATGDSITLGNNTSGYMQIPPYMPTWLDLFTGQLKNIYGYDAIKSYNAALGGMTSQWGLDTAEKAVASLNPDLVIIAYGMNDFWSLSGDEFLKNIKGTIDVIRARHPNVEFVLISSMQYDPAYTKDGGYAGHMASYVKALKSLKGSGVELLDMNAISGALFAAKKPKDIIANPLHPNDFLARWYAQGLTAMLTEPSQTSAKIGVKGTTNTPKND